MKTHSDCFEHICSYDNLERALFDASRGRRMKPVVAAWRVERERRLARLHRLLSAGDWWPSGGQQLLVRDPKPRVILAPSFEESIVHHALCRVMGPLLERSFIHDTWACLRGRGAQRAVLRHQEFMRCHRLLLQLDVRKYFPSVSHARLLEFLGARFPEPRLLALVGRILSKHDGLYLPTRIRRFLGDERFVPTRGRGLPVGMLTSQVWGNAFLSPLDHFAKRELKIRGWIRYMDDTTAFGNSRAQLRAWRRELTAFLKERLDLEVRDERTRILSCGGEVEYLGWRVSRERLRPTKRLYERLRRRLERWAAAPPSEDRMRHSLASTLGSLKR